MALQPCSPNASHMSPVVQAPESSQWLLRSSQCTPLHTRCILSTPAHQQSSPDSQLRCLDSQSLVTWLFCDLVVLRHPCLSRSIVTSTACAQALNHLQVQSNPPSMSTISCSSALVACDGLILPLAVTCSGALGGHRWRNQTVDHSASSTSIGMEHGRASHAGSHVAHHVPGKAVAVTTPFSPSTRIVNYLHLHLHLHSRSWPIHCMHSCTLPTLPTRPPHPPALLHSTGALYFRSRTQPPPTSYHDD